MADVEKWNNRYAEARVEDARPGLVLAQNVHLLPRSGMALDLACGLGGNARLLASRGLETRAWDLSQVAVEKLNRYARQCGLPLLAEQRDVERQPPSPESFDVVVVAHFLDRALAPRLVEALRPGGLLYYQTFTNDYVDAIGPKSAEYRLAPNELLQMFSGMRVVVYREEGRIGDLRQGWRNEAMLVAQREPGHGSRPL